YRAITYSQRYNYPNTNKPVPNYSYAVAADDLAAFIKKLDLGKVHVVGHSMGGLAALVLTVKHPELVRTLTLSDPGIFFKGDPPDEGLARTRKAAKTAFEQRKREEALRAIIDFLSDGKVKFDELPPEAKKRLMRNALQFEVTMAGNDPLPEVDRDDVRKIAVPTLVTFGEKSPPIFKTIEKKLMSVLPEKDRKLVIQPDAAHSAYRTHAEAWRKEILEFLKGK